MFDCVWPSRTAVRDSVSPVNETMFCFIEPNHDLSTAFRKFNHIQGNYQPAPRFHSERLLPHRTRLHLHLLPQARRRRAWHHESIHLPRSWERNRRSPPVSVFAVSSSFLVHLSLTSSITALLSSFLFQRKIRSTLLTHMITHFYAPAIRVTMHNIHFLLALMTAARTAIINDTYPDFLRSFFRNLYHGQKDKYRPWAVNAVRGVGVDLLA